MPEVVDAPEPGRGLFEPIDLGPYRLSNRIVMAPMTRNRAPSQIPGPLNALYYAQRASAGLIVTESTAVSPTGLGWPNSPGIYTKDQISGWRQVTDAVHDKGGVIYVQLWHSGAISHPLTQPAGRLPVAPSAVQLSGTVRTSVGRQPLQVPRELGDADIRGIIEEFRIAAQNAIVAGFDGIEVHGGNGFLIHQFLCQSTNRRTDRYGGSIRNRCRLLCEVSAAVADTVGPDRVGVHLSPTNPTNFGLSDPDPAELTIEIFRQLDQLGISYVHMVEGSITSEPATRDLDWNGLRRRFRGRYIANNSFTRDTAERALSQRADLVSFGRLFIANPDLVWRFAKAAPLNPLDTETIYSPDHRGYTDYPFLD